MNNAFANSLIHARKLDVFVHLLPMNPNASCSLDRNMGLMYTVLGLIDILFLATVYGMYVNPLRVCGV